MFARPEEASQETPLRIVFLSVEGNETEADYFEWVQKYRSQLGIFYIAMSVNQQVSDYGIHIKYGNPYLYSIVKVKLVWNIS